LKGLRVRYVWTVFKNKHTFISILSDKLVQYVSRYIKRSRRDVVTQARESEGRGEKNTRETEFKHIQAVEQTLRYSKPAFE
jgi:hypothetical protein